MVAQSVIIPVSILSILKELAELAISNNYNCEIILSIMLHPNANSELIDPLYSIFKDNFDKSKSIDFYQLKSLTDLEIKRLGWTTEIGRNHLIKTYGKRSRLRLTDKQLIDFWKYLAALLTPDIK